MLLDKILALYIFIFIYICEAYAKQNGLEQNGILDENDLISYARQMCQIRYNERFFCGCLFLKNSYVLTTAQCAKRIKQQIPRNERTNGALLIQTNFYSFAQRAIFEQAFIHPNFNNQTKANDIAIVKTKNKITIDGETAVAISLPIGGPAEGTICHAYKWVTYNEIPEANVHPKKFKIAKFEECSKLFGDMKGRLCAVRSQENAEPCEGSFCGPLLCDGQWVGLHIMNLKKNVTYEAFTNLLSYRDWLMSIVARDALRRRSSGSSKAIYSKRISLVFIILLLIV